MVERISLQMELYSFFPLTKLAKVKRAELFYRCISKDWFWRFYFDGQRFAGIWPE